MLKEFTEKNLRRLWGGLGVALVWPWCSLGVALVGLWCGFRVPLYPGVYA